VDPRVAVPGADQRCRALARRSRLQRLILRAAALSLIAGTAVLASGCATDRSTRVVRLATTTSVHHSGLLDVLLPAFGSQTGIAVQVVTPGSGIALNMLIRGDVDVTITHAPRREAELLRDRIGWLYRKIMFNDFVVVGPFHDPAQVKGSPAIEEAMRRIAASGVRFISRGDSSGTHERERDLWTGAGVVPNPQRVIVAGGGMGATLRVAGSTGAYTLTDRATFEQHAHRGELAVLFEGGPGLLNAYAVAVPPKGRADAHTFATWLIDGDGRRLIAGFRTAHGAPAFTVWPAGCPRDLPPATPCVGTRREQRN
jgi:tungstate transport system substrate-binding protein